MKKLVSRLKRAILDGKRSREKEIKNQKKKQSLCRSLDRNIAFISSYLSDSDDIVYRELDINTVPGQRGYLIYIETLVEEATLLLNGDL